MGSLADRAAFLAAIRNPDEILRISKLLTVATGVGWASGWKNSGGAAPYDGDVPTTAVLCDRTTNGALGQQNAVSGGLRMWVRSIATPSLAASIQMQQITFADRLAHMGGLSGIVTTAQTVGLTTLPSRATGGDGVRAAVEIYTTLGTTATTFTCDVDTDKGTGLTTPAMPIGSTTLGQNAARKMIPIPVPSGSKDILKVNSLTLAASTVTAGNFGVFLYRPIITMTTQATLTFSGPGNVETSHQWQLREVDVDACLFPYIYGVGAATLAVQMELGFKGI